MKLVATENNNENIAGVINQSNNEESNVIAFIRNIFKKWWLFLLFGIAGGVTGIFYAGKQKPVYQSHLTFALDEGGSEGDMSGAMGLAAQFGISIGGAKDVFTGENILEIMKSRRIIEMILLSTDTFENKPYTFIEYYIEKIVIPSGTKVPSGIHYLPGEDKKLFSYAKDSLLYNIYLEFSLQNIAATRPNRKLNIFEVSVVSGDEKFTKKFTDKLIEATNNFYTQISSKKSRETLSILEKRTPEMKNNLNSSIVNKALAEDANLNPVFAEAQVPVLREQANAQVYASAYAEMYKNLEMARFQYLKSIPLMQVIDSADYPMKKIKVSKLKTAIVFSIISAFIALVIFIFYYHWRITGKFK